MRTTIAVVVCALLTSGICAADDQIVTGRTQLPYFACVEPDDTRCYALTEKQKGDCKPCQKWEARVLDRDFSVELEAKRYLYRGGAPKGSKVLADFVASATGEEPERQPTFSQIYSMPRKYGYLEVPRDVEVQAGMAAVYPNFGGVVATEADAASEATIVYSSERSEGDLKVRQLAYVAPASEVKFVISTSLFEIRDAAYWNVWTRPAPGGAPTKVLRPGTSYNLHFDLAAFAYGDGAAASAVGQNARDTIRKWLDGTADTLNIDLVLVTGDQFDDSNARNASLPLDLRKMRSWYGPATAPAPVHAVPHDPLADAASGSPQPWLFGAAPAFQIKTADDAKGMAVLTVTMWRDVPVDELTFTVCIASEGDEDGVCKAGEILSRSFSGIPTTPVKHRPDLAVTFVASDPAQRVRGIFRDNRPGTDGRFVQWRLNKTMPELRTYIAQTLEPSFNTGNLLVTGLGLAKELFPTEPAQTAFTNVVAKQLEQALPEEPDAPPAPENPPLAVPEHPRILFRVIDADGLALLPVSFLVWPRADGTHVPVAFHYILDIALGEPVEKEFGDCISRWILLYPAAPETIPENPAELDPVIGAALHARTTLERWATAAATPFAPNDINDFAKWVSSGKDDIGGTALVLLTHHAKDTMWFVTNQPITASLVGRSFTPPAVAILNGCGTGGSAANEFARRLSARGVQAIVVTNTNIAPDLAGDYLNLLAEELRADQSRTGFDFAHAHFHTLRRLRTKLSAEANPRRYNERALSFMLAGNGRVKLCAPVKE